MTHAKLNAAGKAAVTALAAANGVAENTIRYGIAENCFYVTGEHTVAVTGFAAPYIVDGWECVGFSTAYEPIE